MKVEFNIIRLEYLLNLYRISVEELLEMISKGLKKPIIKDDIFSSEIKLNHLKRIDKVFNKGLYFYLDPKAPETSKEVSIFFRKEKFHSELNIGAKKIVNHFEEFKISLSAISKLAELKIERIIPVFTINHNPKSIANEIRKYLYPEFNNYKKEFLKSLIAKFAEQNILVFEFVETWNKKEKANIDGFFLNPNVIVLKRHQEFLRREIFTLIHELGHFLLDEEEIEKIDYQILARKNLSRVERWCNDFAYYFLIGEFDSTMTSIQKANSENDYCFEIIETISQKTHLSKLALFTRLLYKNKISNRDYNKIKSDFEEQYKRRKGEDLIQKELNKERGIKSRGSVPKPINSPLLISTIQTAFYEGVINEFEVCKSLNIKPEKIEQFIS